MRLEIDGVPVFYRKAPGPLRAALIFRVGMVDEQLHERGLTHLVEHLALSKAPEKVHAYNGMTGSHLTQFVIAGDEDDVVEFLHLVCEGLREPHLDRLEHEQSVLSAEAAQQRPFAGEDQLIWRYGPKGLAMSAYPEWGRKTADRDDVDAWIHQYFHAGNCALWITGPPPKDLRLELPAGEGVAPVPAGLEQAVIAVPSTYGRGRADVAFSWVVPDKRGAFALSMLVNDRLTTALRHEAGLSYGARTTVDAAGNDHVWQMFSVDATDANAQQVQQGVIDVLTALRTTPPTLAEIKQARTSFQLARQSADALVGHLDQWTRNVLLGKPPVTIAEADQRWAELAPEQVAELVPQALETLLIGAPFPADVPAELAQQAPEWSETTFRGVSVMPVQELNPQDPGVLFLSKQGMSLVRDGGRVISIAVADCAAVFRYDDGSIQVYGRDGFTLFFATEDWVQQGEIAKWVTSLPPGLVHPAGGRTRRERTPVQAEQAKPVRRRQLSRTNGWRLGLPLLFVLTAVVRAISAADSTSLPPPTSSIFPGVEYRTGLPTSLSPGDCFNGQGTKVLCSKPHEHQVLDGPQSASVNDAQDVTVCETLWSPEASSHPEFTVTPQLQRTTPGNATLLCVVSRADGKPSSGNLLAAG